MTLRLGDTPQEILNPAGATGVTGVTRTLYVDGARTDNYEETGSSGQPFKTVQGAVDYAEDNLSPAYDNPVEIYIAPQTGGLVYSETVIIKRDGISLHGSGAGWTGRAGVERVIVTNATDASLADFIANGGLADPAGEYWRLQQDSYEPWGCYIKDLNIGNLDTYTYPALMALGVGAGNDMFSYGFELYNCQIFGSSYYRLVNWVWFYGNCWLYDEVTIYNVRAWAIEDGGVYSFIADVDTTDDMPGGATGTLVSVEHANIGGDLTLSGDAMTLLARQVGNIGGNVTVSESAVAQFIQPNRITGTVTLSGSAVSNILLPTNIGGLISLSGSSYCYISECPNTNDITLAGSAQLDIARSTINGDLTFGDTSLVNLQGPINIFGNIVKTGASTLYCNHELSVSGTVSLAGSSNVGMSGSNYFQGAVTIGDTVNCWVGNSRFENTLTINDSATFDLRCGGSLTNTGGLTVNNSAVCSIENMRVGFNAGITSVNVNSTATLRGYSCHFDCAVAVAGDATMNLYNTYVQGDMVLQNAGWLVPCVMNAGDLIGTLTDAGNRLTWTNEALHSDQAGEINALTAATVASTDQVMAEDADDGYNKKKVTALSIANLLASASTTVQGKVELATQTEANTGTDSVRAMVPSTAANLRKRVSDKTAGYTILATDVNKLFTNAGATVEVEFDLPSAAAGLGYTFYVMAAYNLKVTAQSGETIRLADEVTITGGSVEASTVGHCITVAAVSATEWVVTSGIGTWTVETV